MKLMVDKMPVTANECLFSAMGTGKPRCRHDAKLCPLLRGEGCPYLMEGHNVIVGVDLAQGDDLTGAVPEPKKRTTKRSTAKKAE
jgi:hypothetical protein